MSILLNGTTISSINLNGNELTKINLNGTTIYEGIPPYYNELKNGQTLTEAQWLAFLDGNGIKYIIDKGETSTFLKKKVRLTNTTNSTYVTWSIGDFNHDSTSNTCDLILDNNIYMTVFGSYQTYSNSTARTLLNGTYYDGFSSDIKNKLQTMAMVSGVSILQDKVKLLSITEVGSSHTYAPVEGTKYPIFTDNNNRIRTGTSTQWWVRTRYTNSVYLVWSVNSNGWINSNDYSSRYGLVPVIRFAQ